MQASYRDISTADLIRAYQNAGRNVEVKHAIGVELGARGVLEPGKCECGRPLGHK